jgi:hypothetical protein
MSSTPEKKIEDYLHYYLGHIDVKCPKLSGWEYSQKRAMFDFNFWYRNHEKKLIPILRPLSDMTEKEAVEMHDILNAGTRYIEYSASHKRTWLWLQFNSESAKYETIPLLLSRGFDLFGLIEAGLAIDKTSIQPK